MPLSSSEMESFSKKKARNVFEFCQVIFLELISLLLRPSLEKTITETVSAVAC